MTAPRAWLLCLLLLALDLRAAASRARQHSMEVRTPDINPAWYAGRGIRPVGRFGRRGATLREVPRPSPRCLLICHRVPGNGLTFPQDGYRLQS
ncbi:PREDICTED: prolactin-releasing peptide [Chinchilla lanigera]|uniref:Prolactin releasing hormone n=1 Tax=Chinchilla lanigera TaxID=34839 RepID=A0A8C2UNV2_CHILA|nr:PREDICTED: prolactin-releasing peptide [Chinchilla lanigera]